ncbi:MAG: hypothetical protein J07HR59_00070 [Halorubrum sp. J07HR59]|nr:MAG: hypothetical protein J07HR59_00070 [Halorubrum sp. J07HR59]
MRDWRHLICAAASTFLFFSFWINSVLTPPTVCISKGSLAPLAIAVFRIVIDYCERLYREQLTHVPSQRASLQWTLGISLYTECMNTSTSLNL